MSTTIVLVTDPRADKHHRTVARPVDYGAGEHTTVYVKAQFDYQRQCDHAFVNLERFGDARCDRCEAFAWSPNWVAAGVFGEGTEPYIVTVLEGYAEQAAVGLVETELGGVIIDNPTQAQINAVLADVDESTPAMLPASNKHGRPGLAVPVMERDVR